MDERAAVLNLAIDSLQFECLDYGIARMTAGMSTGWRSLPFAATSFCHQGQSLLRFDAGSRRVRVGETICLAPHAHHSADIVKGRTMTYWNHLIWRVFGSVDLLDLFEVPLVLTGAGSRRIGVLNWELLELMKRPEGAARAIGLRALGHSILAVIVEHSKPRAETISYLQALNRLAPVLKYIDEHLDAPFDRDELAEIAHLSASRFNAIFKAALCQPPREYVQRKRLQRAQQLLISTELPIQEIAQRSGHRDPFHFTRTFTRVCGLNPTQYRQNARTVRL